MNTWLIITVSIAFLVSAFGAYLGVKTLRSLRDRKRALTENGEQQKIPMAAIQQRALWNILSMFIGLIILFWMFDGHAVTDFFKDDTFRISSTGVLCVMLLINLFLMLPTSKKGKWSELFDERDELVLTRAGTFQLVGILLLSVIWTVGLTEYYWTAGAIPIDIPYLMFWSNFLMLFLSRSIGIVYGYWWMDRYGN